MIKAVAFDIGHTLVHYNHPIDWKTMYRPALEQTAMQCGYWLKIEDYNKAIDILMKYNTRINPREKEVSSDKIVGEILEAWGKSSCDVINYFDLTLTSNDIGFRKPNIKGLRTIADKFGIAPEEMVYVGDEEKDIICANNGGAVSVLIDRKRKGSQFGQKYKIHSLGELCGIIK